MHHGNAFSIHIFLPSGSVDVLRVVKKDNWSGRAIAFRREAMRETLALEDLNAPGVYLLRAQESDGIRLYIGETANLATRLRDHARDEAEQDFWTNAVVFVRMGDGLDKADVQYLEARLIRLADEAGQIIPAHSNRPDPSGKLETDKEAAAEGFLENLLECLRALGIGDFDPPQSGVPAQPAPSSDLPPSPPAVAVGLAASDEPPWHILTVPSKGVEARGRQLTDKIFIVEAGATAAAEIVNSLRSLPFKAALKRRNDMISDGRLGQRSDGQGYVLTRDEEFRSPSQAEAVLAGRAGSGLTNWVPEDSSDSDEPAEQEDDAD